MDIELQFYWPPSLSREDKIRNKIKYQLLTHPDNSSVEDLVCIFRHLKNRDFCILTFGNDPSNFLQYTHRGNNFVLDFPWSTGFGRRWHYRDTIQLMLESRGYHRKKYWFMTESEDHSKFFVDHMLSDKYPNLIISFGKNGKVEAAQVSLEIALNIFHVPNDCSVDMKLGHW